MILSFRECMKITGVGREAELYIWLVKKQNSDFKLNMFYIAQIVHQKLNCQNYGKHKKCASCLGSFPAAKLQTTVHLYLCHAVCPYCISVILLSWSVPYTQDILHVCPGRGIPPLLLSEVFFSIFPLFFREFFHIGNISMLYCCTDCKTPLR